MVTKMANEGKMKAIVCSKYGPPEILQLQEVDKPTPKDTEVLLRNYGSSINTVVDLLRKAYSNLPLTRIGFRSL
jgi:NADPH:quinone reductase-like Zn-dependent oxidoreductase